MALEEGARARFAGLIVGGATLCAAFAAVGLAAHAGGPPAPGVWRMGGPQVGGPRFRGSFSVSADGRFLTQFHGVALAAARRGCPVVHAGETIVLPAKIPITHVVTNGFYDVQAPSKTVVLLPLKTVVIAGGKRHAGAIEISWAALPDASVDITYGNLAQEACHISTYAVPPG